RSQDDTASIVERRAASDERVRLVRISELPPHWTGKTHALYQAQKQAPREWLFFVDSDTQMNHPLCLSILLRDCVDNSAALESLLPASTSESLWVAAFQ